MKTGASRLKLPPVISSSFSFNQPEEMMQEEIPSITSLGPVNIPNALRRYGNLNQLATFKGTTNRVTIAPIVMEAIATHLKDLLEFR